MSSISEIGLIANPIADETRAYEDVASPVTSDPGGAGDCDLLSQDERHDQVVDRSPQLLHDPGG